MTNIKDLKIKIVEINSNIAKDFKRVFALEKNVEIVNEDFVEYMQSNNEVDCIVSPANSFGRMTGGFDAAISDFLGWDFQKNVQDYIDKHFFGEQVVGTSFYIKTGKEGIGLIHTPTMRVPERIIDPRIIYHCMRSSLICALENNVKCIVVPAFGGACGAVDSVTIVDMMYKGYSQIKNNMSRMCIIDTGEIIEKIKKEEVKDNLFFKACDTVFDNNGGSIVTLQRVLGVSFPRAVKLIDLLIKLGLLSSEKDPKIGKYKLLLTREEWEQRLKENI